MTNAWPCFEYVPYSDQTRKLWSETVGSPLSAISFVPVVLHRGSSWTPLFSLKEMHSKAPLVRMPTLVFKQPYVGPYRGKRLSRASN